MKKNLSIIVPTLNEEENITLFFDKIYENLKNLNIIWELIFVDDSINFKTSKIINELREKHQNVFLIKRYEKRGLSSALLQGALSSNAEYILFIDADLQHPPEYIIDLYNSIKKRKCDIVSASRFMNKNKFLNKKRYKASILVNYFLQKLFKINYTDILTGFFIIDRMFLFKYFNQLSNIGFKLLLDIVLTSKKNIKYFEIPFEFKPRYKGISKLNNKVLIDFFSLLLDKIF